jgi:hypothetical protein
MNQDSGVRVFVAQATCSFFLSKIQSILKFQITLKIEKITNTYPIFEAA